MVKKKKKEVSSLLVKSGRCMESAGAGEVQCHQYHEGYAKTLLRDYGGKCMVKAIL